MAKGPRKHLKRLAAPGHWQIQRKVRPFTIRSHPGPHALHESVPLGIIIRDMLHLTSTYNETRRIIAQGQVKVDGRIRKVYKYPVGLMDVIEVPETKTYLRVVPDSRHFLQLHKITKKETSLKPCKITGKSTTKKGYIQLHLHDGRTILLKITNPKAKPKEKYKTGDTLLIKIPDQTIQTHIPLKKDVTAIITGGDHTGFVGKLMKIDTENRLGTLKGGNKKTILTAIRYVFPLGEEKSLISIPEAE